MFETQYFDEKAYFVAKWSALHGGDRGGLGKVYCFGPTFEPKVENARHLIEFWMVEPEVAFADLDDNMELAEQFVEYIVQRVLKNRPDEMQALERDTDKLSLVKAPFLDLHYEEAAGMVKSQNPEFTVGDDFGGADETIISSKYDRPVFVHRYPTAIKAFT